MKNKDAFYMSLAVTMSTASYCERSKVGALLEKDGNIIAFGYNGMPAGFDNSCEFNYEYPDGVGEVRTRPEVLHAESNAIAKCARSAVSSEGATMYVTTSPCIECAKLIVQAGIKRVVFKEEYRLNNGLILLDEAGIKIYRL